MEKKSKVIFFDFDGVLFNSLKALYKINKVAANKIGRKISVKKNATLFQGNIHKNLKFFLNTSLAEHEEFLNIKKKIFFDYYNLGKVKMFDFTHKMLSILNNIASIYIITSAPLESVKCLIDENHLNQYITKSYSTNIGKAMILKEIMDLPQNKNCDFYFITDTAGDISETVGINLKTIGVTWGFHSKKILIEAKADYVVDNYRQILLILLSN